ncbi:metal-dependent hydrolase [Stenotrophomonas oahuensis]|uniref:Metal-dependent hydrolase n=1 Tax=Stenotrophomonas oahuensis TaxID=3003271 RepID=A0ABY9YRT5_9GAMM|nr:metal-dependent hydrolase [Stenotrophomonas sp. A5586]WNH53636.1 metal-dependent hydrolase [Stenotrophomonas sp. A5586]
MSSIVGHTATGITAFLACSPRHQPLPRWSVLPFVVLAVCPDVDYFAVWLFGYAANPRITHSLLFSMVATLLVWRALKRTTPLRFPLPALLAASVSHPVLDLLVGAHPVPLLWPFCMTVSAPIGLLPSAGALSPGNYYLWRNLIIELGVLVPVLALIVAGRRGCPAEHIRAWALRLLVPWMAFLIWSMSLTR